MQKVFDEDAIFDELSQQTRYDMDVMKRPSQKEETLNDSLDGKNQSLTSFSSQHWDAEKCLNSFLQSTETYRAKKVRTETVAEAKNEKINSNTFVQSSKLEEIMKVQETILTELKQLKQSVDMVKASNKVNLKRLEVKMLSQPKVTKDFNHSKQFWDEDL